jgi:Gram-negative bacterial TonB protein C-terminal
MLLKNFQLPEVEELYEEVKIKMTISIDGKITNVKIIKESGNTIIGKEAKRVLFSCPKWIPENITVS